MSEPHANKPHIALLGIPIEIGASQAGTLMGPAALRTAGIGRILDQLGFGVEDHGDMATPGIAAADGPAPANTKYYDEVGAWVRALSERAWDMRAVRRDPDLHGRRSLAVDGIGERRRAALAGARPAAVRAVARCPCRLQHAGNDRHRQHARHVGRVPLRRAGLDGLLGNQPRVSISPDQLDLFGIRSIDPLEKKLVHERPIAVADMRAIDEFGVAVLIRKVIERVRARNGVLHVSFDVDFLDPAVAPGVGTTVPGGATYREAHLIMELLHDSGLVRSVDIVELNPFLDERGRTARVAVELIGSLFGLQITDRRTPSNAVFPDNS